MRLAERLWEVRSRRALLEAWKQATLRLFPLILWEKEKKEGLTFCESVQAFHGTDIHKPEHLEVAYFVPSLKMWQPSYLSAPLHFLLSFLAHYHSSC